MTATYKLDNAVMKALKTLPTVHPVFLNWYNTNSRTVYEWWDRAKHNVGPEWDEFRLKVIEFKHLS